MHNTMRDMLHFGHNRHVISAQSQVLVGISLHVKHGHFRDNAVREHARHDGQRGADAGAHELAQLVWLRVVHHAATHRREEECAELEAADVAHVDDVALGLLLLRRGVVVVVHG